MYVSVIERTFEIGLRRAVGAKRNDVRYQFLAEAIILTFFGGVFGIIIGAGVALVIYFLALAIGLNWTYNVSVFSIILALAFSGCLGFVFGVFPAQKAAELDPITALRKD